MLTIETKELKISEELKRKIEIICFNTGICFLLFKTIIDGENNNFSDVMNFNYKFRDITSKAEGLKEFENIKEVYTKIGYKVIETRSKPKNWNR